MPLKDDKVYEVFEQSNVLAVTILSVITGTIGLIANGLVILVIILVFGAKNVHNIFWINVGASFLFYSLGVLYNAVSTHIPYLCSSETLCRLRYGLPISCELICIGNLSMFIIERLFILYFAGFSRVLPKVTQLMTLYGWVCGIIHLLAVLLKVHPYLGPDQCHSHYIDQSPPELTSLFTYIQFVALIIGSVICFVYVNPEGVSHIDKVRMRMEMPGASLVVWLGASLALLSSVKHIYVTMYWLHNVDHIRFQIYFKWYSMGKDLGVLLPFIALLSRQDFRSSLHCLLTCRTHIIKRKMTIRYVMADTVTRLADAQRKNTAGRANLKDDANEAYGRNRVSDNDPSAFVTSVSEPKARDEYCLLDDNLK